jgi:hypothetical protein
VQQLLWVETLLKFSAGLLLLLLPLSTLRLFGLPRPDTGFWPRLCGALLVGIAASTFIEGASFGHGLGLGGSILINLVGVAVLGTLLVSSGAPPTLRGRLAVWLTVCALVILSLLEMVVV